MLTRSMLVETVRRALNGGANSTAGRATDGEIIRRVNGALAARLKAQFLIEVLKDEGDSTPDGAMIATYENLPVSRRDHSGCSVDLPAQPMAIQGGLGVFSVYPSGYPEREYIPIQSGLQSSLRGHKMINSLSRKTYTPESERVIIHHDIVGEGVTTVDMKLLVMDIGRMGDHAPIPVPEDMENAVFAEVLQMFGIESPVPRQDSKAASPRKEDVKQ